MEMFLMVICMTVFGLAVSALAFGAATRGLRHGDQAGARLEARVDEALATMPERFFVRDTAPIVASPSVILPRVPIEVLLARIEHHVRLEQAAAESFVAFPTVEALQGRTTSPLVH